MRRGPRWRARRRSRRGGSARSSSSSAGSSATRSTASPGRSPRAATSTSTSSSGSRLFDADTLLPWSMLFRTPGTPLVVGPLLDLFGGALAEPVSAVLYAGSIVAWAAAARTWGPRAALAVAAVAALLPRLRGDVPRARQRARDGAPPSRSGRCSSPAPRCTRRSAASPPPEPPSRSSPSSARGTSSCWRSRSSRSCSPGRGATASRWAGAFAAAAVLPLLAWTLHNGLRYDEWGLARGGKAVIPLYRALLFDRIVGARRRPRLTPARAGRRGAPA